MRLLLVCPALLFVTKSLLLPLALLGSSLRLPPAILQLTGAPDFVGVALAFSKQRARLLDEFDAYRDLIESASTTWAQRNELRRRVQSLEMQLDRYPSLV